MLDLQRPALPTRVPTQPRGQSHNAHELSLELMEARTIPGPVSCPMERVVAKDGQRKGEIQRQRQERRRKRNE